MSDQQPPVEKENKLAKRIKELEAQLAKLQDTVDALCKRTGYMHPKEVKK